MSAHTFFVTDRAAIGDSVALSGAEGRHAVTVRRIEVGEPVELIDGAGWSARATVTAVAGKDSLALRIDDVKLEADSDPQIVVAQALLKGDAGERAVTMMTEVGIDAIQPWSASRSIVQWKSDRRGRDKWETAAREAAKQSHRSRIPQVEDAVTTAQLVRLVPDFDCVLVLHEAANQSINSVELPTHGRIMIVIGPEGGIADHEREALSQAGARTVRLGPSVLRGSTAGTVAAGIVLSRTARWAVGGSGS